MSGADLDGFTPCTLDTLKDAMKDAGLQPGWWDSRRKNKLRSYCPHNSDIPHSVGNPKFKLKVWIENSEIIAQCDDCGRLDPSLISLKDVRTPTADYEPSATTPECPPEPRRADSSHVLPVGDDSPIPEVEAPKSAPYEPPPRRECIEPELPHGREPGSDDEPKFSVEPEPKKEPKVSTDTDHTFIWLDDFCTQPPSTSWLVREYLELDSLAAIFGDSEAGKSFLSIDLSCHIAHGLPWCGHKVKQGIVLYIAGEGQNGLKRRFKAWHEHYGMPVKKNIAVRTIPTALCEPAKVNELVDYIKKLIASIGKQPVFIVIDTLNRNFGNGNENDTKDMTSFVSGLDCLRTTTGACLMVVHHCGHGDKSRMRAAISLHNAVDSEYLLVREGDRQEITSLKSTLTNTKTKEGLTPKPLSWNWETQSLPWCELDDRGFPVPMFSAVLVPTDYVEPVKKVVIGEKHRQALDILKALYSTHRQNLVDAGHDPEGAKVTVADWSKATMDIDPHKQNRSDVRKSLETKGLVIISDGYVYLT